MGKGTEAETFVWGTRVTWSAWNMGTRKGCADVIEVIERVTTWVLTEQIGVLLYLTQSQNITQEQLSICAYC